MKKLFSNLTLAIAFLTVTAISTLAIDKISDFFNVPAYQTRWHQVYFSESSFVDIEISGDGSSDLDLYIYDGNSRYIISSESDSDYELAEIQIVRGGTFYIAVVNHGETENDYELIVNEY